MSVGQSAHSHMMMTMTIRIFGIGPGFSEKMDLYLCSQCSAFIRKSHYYWTAFWVWDVCKGYLLHENHEGVKYSSCFEVHWLWEVWILIVRNMSFEIGNMQKREAEKGADAASFFINSRRRRLAIYLLLQTLLFIEYILLSHIFILW